MAPKLKMVIIFAGKLSKHALQLREHAKSKDVAQCKEDIVHLKRFLAAIEGEF